LSKKTKKIERKSKRKLLFSVTKKDLEISYFSGSGAGGQHRNKSKNCVRIKHSDSRVVVIGTEQRSRAQNKKTAFKRLVNHVDFKNWLKFTSLKKSHNWKEIEKEINAWVDEQMKEENLKIEYGV